MRKFLLVSGLVVLVGLTGCNTTKGLINGVGKDLSAVGSSVKSGGDYVQDKITPEKSDSTVDQIDASAPVSQ